jgi:Molybdopterin-binding domain of aldehyde dehydrogenase
MTSSVTALLRGEPQSLLQQAGASVIERRYVLPHIAHAPMEPVNATAHYQDGKVEVWGSIQSVSPCQDAAGPAHFHEVAEYLMLRGVFTTPGVTPDQLAYYVDVLKKVRDTPEWKALMTEGAFNQTFMTGADFDKWLTGEEARHRQLMQEAGFLAGN